MAGRRPLATRVFCPSALCCLLAACGGNGDPDDGNQPQSITIAGGNLQSARYATDVAVAPAVLVTGNAGPLAGVTVTFTVESGGGTVEDAIQATNAQGVATAGRWTLGPGPGTNILRAAAGSVSVDITAIATSGPPAAMVVETGDNQSWVERGTLPVRPAVRVTDGAFGVAGVEVTFAVASGGGTVALPVVRTNSAGVATVGSWRLGNVGTNTLTAIAGGIPTPVTFTADAAALVVSGFSKVRGDNQTGFAGNFAPDRVEVQALNQFGQPAEGVIVTFAVGGGGGTVHAPVDTTLTTGRATLGSWRFGAAGPQSITATAGTSSTTFTANATPVPASQFAITIRYVAPAPSAAVQAAFTAAANRWAQLVVGDLPDVVLSGSNTIPEGTLNTGIVGVGTITCVPALANQTLDDMVIYASIRNLDGAGAVLGFATPYYGRTADGTTIAGCMVFDQADMAELESTGRLQDVILHEMGHVIGVGANWPEKGLLVGGCPAASPTPYFTGSSGRNAFIAALVSAFPDSIVPVEGNGPCSEGTRDGHWRESVLDSELMTGFVELSGPNPLSAITAASVRDLGYVVNDAVSDGYSLPRAPGAARAAGRHFKLNELDVRPPRVLLDTRGNIVSRRDP